MFVYCAFDCFDCRTLLVYFAICVDAYVDCSMIWLSCLWFGLIVSTLLLKCCVLIICVVGLFICLRLLVFCWINF